jgi:Domain of Unknown Function (DUF1080)
MLKLGAVGACLLSAGLLLGGQATPQPGGPKFKGAWTDPQDKTLPADFKIQGEYVGQFSGGGKLGAQVISLGKDAFQAVLLIGGLPGDGWDGQNKILMDGKREGDNANFLPSTGKRKYNAPKAEEFSATAKFPPPGQEDCTASIVDGVLRGKTAEGKAFELKRTIRTSPTAGLKPPPGAFVLFDGAKNDEVKGGRVDKDRGILHTDGKDISTTRKFKDFTVHAEFMTAYRPDARGQGRGNSGVYLVNQYEVQILDSFGQDGKKNECGSIYEKVPPTVHMCLPPLQWQTYDIDFTCAVQDDQGKKVKNPRVTVKHNGVLIHDDAEITGKTGVNSRKDPEGTPGVLLLQGHNNPTQFRNVWVFERK